MMCLFYRWIITAAWQRITTQYAPYRQAKAFYKTIMLKTIAGILRAAGHIFAMHAKVRAQSDPIDPDATYGGGIEYAQIKSTYALVCAKVLSLFFGVCHGFRGQLVFLALQQRRYWALQFAHSEPALESCALTDYDLPHALLAFLLPQSPNPALRFFLLAPNTNPNTN